MNMRQGNQRKGGGGRPKPMVGQMAFGYTVTGWPTREPRIRGGGTRGAREGQSGIAPWSLTGTLRGERKTSDSLAIWGWVSSDER